MSCTPRNSILITVSEVVLNNYFVWLRASCQTKPRKGKRDIAGKTKKG